MSIFDLEDDVELVKHKSETGLVKSKSVARSNSKRPPNNRLFTLQQSLSPARSYSARFSSAYGIIPGSAYSGHELTIPNQYYTLACGSPKLRSSKEKIQMAKEGKADPRETIRARMIYLMPVYWTRYDPDAKVKKIPSYQEVWTKLKTTFEEGGLQDDKDKKMLYGGSLVEQMKVWEAFLWKSKEKLFQTEWDGLIREFEQLLTEHDKKWSARLAEIGEKPKEPVLPTLVEDGKTARSLKAFSRLIKDKDDDGKFNTDVFQKMDPASLGYAYLDWYDEDDDDDDKELNVIPEDVKKIFDSFANVVSKSTLTAPKDKKTGLAKPKEYEESFKAIVDAIVRGEKEKSSKPVTKKQIEAWSKEQKTAVTEQLFELQASLGSLYQLLMGGQEVEIGKLKNLALKIAGKADIAGTGLDILAITNASYDTFNRCAADNVSDVSKGVSNFVTDSAWANSYFAPAIITLGGTIHKLMTTDWEKLDLKSVAGKAFSTSLRLAKAGAQAAMFIKDGNKAWGIKPIMAGAKVSTDVAGIVTGGIGVFLNVHAAYKELKEIAKLGGISGRFEGVIKRNKELKKHLDVKFHKGLSRHRIENKNYEAIDVILQKMHHRRSYSAIRYTGAVVGIGAGATAIAIKVAALTAVTLANAWNPVGWALAITSIVAGLGFLGYTGGRRLYKKARLNGLKKRIKNNNGYVPDFCKTTGDFWRYQAALMIYFSSVASRSQETLKTYPAEALFRIAVGRAFAYILLGDPDKKKAGNALDTAFEMGVPGIMEFIKG